MTLAGVGGGVLLRLVVLEDSVTGPDGPVKFKVAVLLIGAPVATADPINRAQAIIATCKASRRAYPGALFNKARREKNSVGKTDFRSE